MSGDWWEPTFRPHVDSNVFKLEQLKEAYEYLASGKHQEKVGIEIDQFD